MSLFANERYRLEASANGRALELIAAAGGRVRGRDARALRPRDP
jgi:hypothetical protein